MEATSDYDHPRDDRGLTPLARAVFPQVRVAPRVGAKSARLSTVKTYAREVGMKKDGTSATVRPPPLSSHVEECPLRESPPSDRRAVPRADPTSPRRDDRRIPNDPRDAPLDRRLTLVSPPLPLETLLLLRAGSPTPRTPRWTASSGCARAADTSRRIPGAVGGGEALPRVRRASLRAQDPGGDEHRHRLHRRRRAPRRRPLPPRQARVNARDRQARKSNVRAVDSTRRETRRILHTAVNVRSSSSTHFGPSPGPNSSGRRFGASFPVSLRLSNISSALSTA